MFYVAFFCGMGGVWFCCGGPTPIAVKSSVKLSIFLVYYFPPFSCFSSSFGFRPKGLSEAGRGIAVVRTLG